MDNLGSRQELFAELLPHLLDHIRVLGWKVRLGDGHVQAGVGHRKNSLHYVRLAQDLNLFIDGEYVTDGRDPRWLTLGRFWESLHPLCRWGGRFQESYDPESNMPLEFTGVDSNHFSLTYQGRA